MQMIQKVLNLFLQLYYVFNFWLWLICSILFLKLTIFVFSSVCKIVSILYILEFPYCI